MIGGFSSWAVALTQHFFGPQFSGQRVRLIVTRQLLDEAFPDIGGTNGLLQVIRSGPEWFEAEARSILVAYGLELERQWRQPHRRGGRHPEALRDLRDAPPFLPLLCLLCLAWTEGDEEDMAGNAFYARLDGLIPDHGLRAHLKEWEGLWQGLEDWTKKLEGSWGCFVLERLGGFPYVGIPKSQVIFTPQKIDRLPGLFEALHLQPRATITDDLLHGLILANEGPSTLFLGRNIVDNILERSPLGQSALGMLREYFENWDGSGPEKSRGGTGQRGQGGSSAGIVLVLHPTEDSARWCVNYGVEEDSGASGIVFPARGWRLLSVDRQLALVADRDTGRPIDSVQWSGEWSGGFSLEGIWREELGDDDRVRYTLPRGAIRLFLRWVGPRLVEASELPLGGGVYVLVGSEGRGDWERWRGGPGALLPMEEYTRAGLPSGWRLYYVSGLEGLNEGGRKSFPSNAGDIMSRGTQVIHLVGGTRVNSSQARRVYADYDPPLVVVRGSDGARVEVRGAQIEEEQEQPVSPEMPGIRERRYALKIEDSADAVVLLVVGPDGQQIGATSFGVLIETALPPPEDGPSIRLDHLAEPVKDGGTWGAEVPGDGTGWTFVDGPGFKGAPLSDDDLGANAFRLLESLSLRSGRLTVQEFRRRALKITGEDPLWFNSHARWLAQLGHLEIQSDSKGRWSYISPNPLQLYLLPRKRNGSFQAVVTGCGPLERLRRLVKLAGELECDIDVSKDGAAMVPPRIAVVHPDRDALELLAEETKVVWVPGPAAYLLAEWAGGLEDWLGHLNWFEGPGPAPDAEYVPGQFRITSLSAHHAPYHLYCMEDPQTRRHLWHTLAHNRIVEGFHHAFVRDRAWGMWKAQNAIADDCETVVPFDPATGSIAVPCGLQFPYLLGRALTMCSGLAPTITRRCPAYASGTTTVLPKDSPLYHGPCWLYQFIPMYIAARVVEKLGGKLQQVSLA